MFPRPLLCWLNFLLLTGTPRSKEKTSWTHWGCSSSWRYVKGGGNGHKTAFPTPETTRAKLCAWHAGWEQLPQAKKGRWHWHFLSKQHFVLKSHKDRFMEKIHAFVCSPTFSQLSPNYNFRIQQRPGTLRPSPLRFQIHHKAVLPTQ